VQTLRARSGHITLSVRVHAGCEDDAPTVLLLHGYPDTQRMWDPVVRVLNREHRLGVVTYDVRGAGASTTPARRADYVSERLVDDLVAVMDRTMPDRTPIHLVGHDWGSVQLWDAVTTEEVDVRLRGRIASFTSISGPGLDYVAYALRRARAERDRSLLSAQARRSWYVYAFHLPWLPELVWKHQSQRLRARLNRAERMADGHWADTLADDGAHGLNLYRANVRQRIRRPRPGRTRVPVQLVVPELDNVVLPTLYRYLEELVPDLTRVDVRAGHWLPRQEPDLVAGLVADHVRRHC
jgi:pimeloyl-ACP methyl ester carboxylesterase